VEFDRNDIAERTREREMGLSGVVEGRNGDLTAFNILGANHSLGSHHTATALPARGRQGSEHHVSKRVSGNGLWLCRNNAGCQFAFSIGWNSGCQYEHENLKDSSLWLHFTVLFTCGWMARCKGRIVPTAHRLDQDPKVWPCTLLPNTRWRCP
jgi:hypothetical protein